MSIEATFQLFPSAKCERQEEKFQSFIFCVRPVIRPTNSLSSLSMKIYVKSRLNRNSLNWFIYCCFHQLLTAISVIHETFLSPTSAEKKIEVFHLYEIRSYEKRKTRNIHQIFRQTWEKRNCDDDFVNIKLKIFLFSSFETNHAFDDLPPDLHIHLLWHFHQSI